MTEDQILKQLSGAHNGYQEAQHALAKLKKELDHAESQLIATKLNVERLTEQLRMIRNRTPKPDTSERTTEIKQFRQDNAELCATVKERDRDKTND